MEANLGCISGREWSDEPPESPYIFFSILVVSIVVVPSVSNNSKLWLLFLGRCRA